MKKINYRLVYNRKKSLNNEGKALVQVEAYLESKRSIFHTHLSLPGTMGHQTCNYHQTSAGGRTEPDVTRIYAQTAMERTESMERRERHIFILIEGHTLTLQTSPC